MKPKFLGDSYDLVKRNLLSWLKPLGDWSVHPMFTDVRDGFVARYQLLLGVPLITTDLIPRRPKRKHYIELANAYANVLFDPDTGLQMRGRGNAPRRVLCRGELLDAVRARPRVITAVFDQSLSYGAAKKELKLKVNALHRAGVTSLAYWSHASFIFASAQPRQIERVYILLLKKGIPECRLIRRLGK